MADHDDGERFGEAKATLDEMHTRIASILRGLPVPVAVPGFGDDSPREALLSLDRARTLIADEPISDSLKNGLVLMVLEWFTAYELAVIRQMGGPAPWRMDALELALTRLAVILAVIESGEIETE